MMATEILAGELVSAINETDMELLGNDLDTNRFPHFVTGASQRIGTYNPSDPDFM